MSLNKDLLQTQIDSIPFSIVNEMEKEVSKHFNKCGLFYRIFSRSKSGNSAVKKIIEKDYEHKDKNMQDLIGVRIALYFKDDIELCVNIIENNFEVLDIVRDTEKSDIFKPQRLNIVCQMPLNISQQFSPELWLFPIDKTFEIQIRTVFSEGWHEVEHDLRYKHSSDWEKHLDLSRNLNGIFATLETCDWAMINVLDQLAYQKYHSGDWEAMLRNHFRIRFENMPLSVEIIDIFNNNKSIAKEFFKAERNSLLFYLCSSEIMPLPKTLNNIVFFANELIVKSPEISAITPVLIKEQAERLNRNE